MNADARVHEKHSIRSLYKLIFGIRLGAKGEKKIVIASRFSKFSQIKVQIILVLLPQGGDGEAAGNS